MLNNCLCDLLQIKYNPYRDILVKKLLSLDLVCTIYIFSAASSQKKVDGKRKNIACLSKDINVLILDSQTNISSRQYLITIKYVIRLY